MQLRDNAGQQLNAEYSVVPDGSQLALILESSGGRTRTGAARNAEYQTALFYLLARLKERDAVLVGALVDSRVTRGLPEPQRTLVDSPVRLAGKLVAEVQQRLTSPQGRIGQREGATKAGNQSKRIRLRLDVPGYTAAEPHRLAADLADPAPSVRDRAGSAGAVRLTSNEVRHAGRAATHLFVVDQIRWTRDSDGTVHTSGGRARRWTAWLPAPENLTPTQYEYRLPPGGEAR
jgi:hypothetical protein